MFIDLQGIQPTVPTEHQGKQQTGQLVHHQLFQYSKINNVSLSFRLTVVFYVSHSLPAQLCLSVTILSSPSLSLPLFLSISLCLSLPSLLPSLFLFLYLSLFLPSLSVFLFIYLTLSLSLPPLSVSSLSPSPYPLSLTHSLSIVLLRHSI